MLLEVWVEVGLGFVEFRYGNYFCNDNGYIWMLIKGNYILNFEWGIFLVFIEKFLFEVFKNWFYVWGLCKFVFILEDLCSMNICEFIFFELILFVYVSKWSV